MFRVQNVLNATLVAAGIDHAHPVPLPAHGVVPRFEAIRQHGLQYARTDDEHVTRCSRTLREHATSCRTGRSRGRR